MGKKVYTVNGNMYIIDDDGKILTIIEKEEPIPPDDLREIIKILAQAANKDD